MTNDIIVQKFGGTSVADHKRFLAILAYIRKEKEKGKKVVVVVSAKAGFTNQIILQCQEIGHPQTYEEYDVALSTGETINSSLIAMTLNQFDIPAKSFQGWQVPIITNSNFSDAKIESIGTEIILETLQKGIIPIISGFQGVNKYGRITTIGRGGSDTTAVALAAALNAESCDIYTDVDGMFSVDPRLINNAHKIKQCSYEEVLEMSIAGAKVVNFRAALIAMQYQVPMKVISAFNSLYEGTTIVATKTMEETSITSITYDKNLYLIETNISDLSSIVKILDPLKIDLKSITTNKDGFDLIISLKHALDLDNLLSNLKEIKLISHYKITDISAICVVGCYLKSNSNMIFKRIMEVIHEYQLKLINADSSEIKIKISLPTRDIEPIVKSLHKVLIENKI